MTSAHVNISPDGLKLNISLEHK